MHKKKMKHSLLHQLDYLLLVRVAVERTAIAQFAVAQFAVERQGRRKHFKLGGHDTLRALLPLEGHF